MGYYDVPWNFTMLFYSQKNDCQGLFTNSFCGVSFIALNLKCLDNIIFSEYGYMRNSIIL